MSIDYALLVYTFVFSLGSKFCSATNSIPPTQFLKDPQTIVSNSSIFKLGFFSPPNSTNRYVGIWYNKPSAPEVIWVANRNNPLTDKNGVFKLSVDGKLQVSNARNDTLWSLNVTHPGTSFSVVQLLDSGNLVVRGFTSKDAGESRKIIWQSFQHPADSLLPNMRLYHSPNSDKKQYLHAWRSPSDPSMGRFSMGTNPLGLFQLIIWDGDRLYWRSGPWNGNIFIGARYHNTGYGGFAVDTGSFPKEEVAGMRSLVFTGANQNLMSHYSLSYEGKIAQKWWDDSKKAWEISWMAPDNECDIYGKCGEFGVCYPHSSPICSCLKGFEPRNKEEWKRGNWTSGCVRKKQLQCGVAGDSKQDRFLRLPMMKVPENAELVMGMGLNMNQCRSACLRNCSCLAYTFDSQLKCLTWSGKLIDVADLSPRGVDLYLKLAQSELDYDKRFKATVAGSLILGTAVAAVIVWFLWRRSQSKSIVPPLPIMELAKKKTESFLCQGKLSQIMIDNLHYKFEKLAEATNNFHERNLLGRGGFGQVYKGKLEDGHEIAIKRLSGASSQGLEEFMNEVALILKLQHRNLIKLLGCCIEREEKMLIYEYMPNKSLDAFLFDPEKHKQLDWQKRFNIIQGVCRGLLYLHRDSRLKIIHRDLKTSNILLDKDLNPKISDFGMARIFGGSQDQDSTQKVVGTYGYMSPEYAMGGHFSEKSDVFSFGVLLIEIISGRKNNNFWYQDYLSLIGYAWKLWNENNIISLVDPSICSAHFQVDIARCMQVGLLCVQELAKDRPSTSTLISMLVGDMDLPKPNPPGFSLRQISSDTGSFPITKQTFSTNDVTITCLAAR